MIKKVDLVMWAKNGTRTLGPVLERISEVVPEKFVNSKILIDDGSTDDTGLIAGKYGWIVYTNKGHGISDGANTALSYVTTEYFLSFEQDLLLAPDWWAKIPTYLSDAKIAAASGIRFADGPPGVRKMQQYVTRKYRGEAELASWLKSREMSAFTLGKTLDNTVYKTSVIRKLGGFPKLRVNAGTETMLAYRLEKAGYHWAVDYKVQSTHLRGGLRQELRHQYFYGSQLREIYRQLRVETNQAPPVTRSGVMYRFFMSPFTGLFMSIKTREPSITYIHPLIRFNYMKGFLEANKKKDEPMH
ncbi:MAG: glycosyltransferase [Candidatus Bathyarchaeia archaeon]